MEIDFEKTLKHKEALMKQVRCRTVDKQSHEGWLKTIDPLTGNLVLVSFDSGETVLVMAQALTDLQVLREADAETAARIREFHREKEAAAVIQGEDNGRRRERLVAWVQKHRLPVRVEEEGGALVVCEAVTVRPPYRAEDCISANGRVLMNVQNLVDSLPPLEEEDVKVEPSTT